MQNLWQNIKLWTKLILTAAVLLYVLLFVYNNTGTDVKLWWWFGHEPQASVFLLTIGAFFVGVIATILIRTLWKTLRQIRNMQDRSRTGKLEREVAEMKTKAAMLQTRPDVDPANSRNF
jgi:lysylphosphatidylglycerol synthetase-like protein (DUF2156 family)